MKTNFIVFITFLSTAVFFLLLIDKLKVYGIQFKKLGLTPFEGLLLLGFTSNDKKLTLISGGLLLLGGRYYRNFTVLVEHFRQSHPQLTKQMNRKQPINPFAPESPVTARTDPHPFYPSYHHQF